MLRHTALLLILCCAPALAHQQSLSYSHWQETDSGLRLVLRHAALDLNRAGLHPAESDYLERSSRYLSARVEPGRGGSPCRLQEASSRHWSEGWVATEMDWRCEGSGDWQLHLDGVFDLAPNHSNLARWRGLDGREASYVFTENRRDWVLDTPRSLAGFSRYLLLGIEHILLGWDHLAFLLALLLLVRRGRDLAWLVTGFTVAHSLTLIAASLQWLAVESAAVEAIIALSILLLCLENAWREQPRILYPTIAALLLASLYLSPVVTATTALGLSLFGLCYALLLRSRGRDDFRLRLLLCFGFGLVHGFGFAGILLDLQIDPASRLISLLGFNLGVEAGQLICVLPAWWLLRRLGPVARQRITGPLNGTAAALACYWLLLRLSGT